MGAHRSAVGSDTALQKGKSRVMEPLEFFTDSFLPATLRSCVWFTL